MPPTVERRLKLAGLAAAVWTAYLLPWPGPAWMELTKPTLAAVAFSVLSWRLGLGSWPLTIVFCLTFFAHGVGTVYLQSIAPGNHMGLETPGTRQMYLEIWALLFSPIALLAPMLFGTAAYALARWRWPAADAGRTG